MPETVILHVLMHCEGCTKSVKRACARIPGVKAYRVDYQAQEVTVTGDVARDEALKCILKTGRHAELLRIEQQPAAAAAAAAKKLESTQQIMGEDQTIVVQTVILKVVLHCEGCARTVKRAVKRIPGVTDYDVDFPGQKVTVTGKVTPEDVYRHVSRTGKITVLVPPPPPPPPPPPEPAPEPPAPAEPAPEPAPAPPAEEPAKPAEEPPKAEEPAAPPAAAEEAKPAEEPKPEEPKPEEPKPAEEPAAPAAEEKKPEEAKPAEEAKPEETKEEAPAPAPAEEAKPDPPPPPEPAAPPPPPPTLEELYPVTFVLGPDYTRYYYY